MSEFALDKFKYVWRGDWQSGVDYKRDDIVRVNGKSYVCIITHTSSSIFRTDQEKIVQGSVPPVPEPRWVVMTSSRSFQGEWTTATNYNIGDIVEFNGSLFVCQIAHTSTNFELDSFDANAVPGASNAKWLSFLISSGWTNNWTGGTSYSYGNTVKYGGIVYTCINPHISTNFSTDIASWQLTYENYEYRGAWSESTQYLNNDIVKYGGTLFVCNTDHTSDVNFNNTNFNILIPGSQYDGDWEVETPYNQGDIIRYGGYLYFAVRNTISTAPLDPDDSSLSNAPSDSDDWILLAKSYRFKGLWNKDYTGSFLPGDIIQHGGNLYRARVAIPEDLLSNDFSSNSFQDNDTWELISIGQIFKRNWQVGETYARGELVLYLGSTYQCNTEHLSDNTNFPGDNGKGFYYWDLLVQAGVQAGMQYPGDMLIFGLQRLDAGDGSTQGPFRIPIGTENQFLRVNDDYSVTWSSYNVNPTIIYVAHHGKDRNGFGLTSHLPFKTVKYACQWIEDNVAADKPSKVFVATGRYTEIGPIIVPANCVVMGDELRSTTIEVKGPLDSYQGNYKDILYAGINRIATLSASVLKGTIVDPQPNSTIKQNINIEKASDEAIASFTELINVTFSNELDYQLGTGTSTSLSGSNNLGTAEYQLASENILANKEFLIEQAYLFNINTAYLYEDQFFTDMHNILRGAARDLKYSGNYATFLAARHVKNCTLGCQFEDIFWMRDTTGLRNMTIEGLSGSLDPVQTFIAYQRPTGGSCVALDPGWGADDDRTWINNRSPYIQGVTNIGEACYGMKIDGSRHNGGNRSMVANDFTQVLSNGVGVHVTNGGHSELVSVFTYYCQIGYWAENGGVIRAANGNNSYGNYGSIAEGNDLNEVPQLVTVNNRQNQAQIYQAFAGGAEDQIIAVEFSHAGEAYTTTNLDIIGAGAFAEAKIEAFRQGGLFQVRLRNDSDSGSAGGANYTVKQNSAQLTAQPLYDTTTEIRLSANEDVLVASEIIGLRITIISGLGVGQYGTIVAYDVVSKKVTIEGDNGHASWDHIIPGWPLATEFDGTTIYRIESKLTCSHPPTSITYHNITSERDYISLTNGYYTKTISNILLGLGSGTTDETLFKTPARINVTKSKENYLVSVTQAGLGYAVGDSFTVLGTTLEGLTPDHDLTFTVTEVSNNSSNSIVNFSVQGTARNSRLVGITTTANTVYSDDGTSWEIPSTITIDATVELKKVIAGNENFIILVGDNNFIYKSTDGENWTAINTGVTDTVTWSDIAYGEGDNGHTYVIIPYMYPYGLVSNNGSTWSQFNMPAEDSSIDEWKVVGYGAGKFVALSQSVSSRSAAVSSDGVTWTLYDHVLPGTEDYKWVKVLYGNNRFLAITPEGITVYSLDHGKTWSFGEQAPNSEGEIYTDITFGQGVFVAAAQDKFVTTEDGIYWKVVDLEQGALEPKVISNFISTRPTFIALTNSTTNSSCLRLYTGAVAKIKGEIATGQFDLIKIWDPGSGYPLDPTDPDSLQITIFDTADITKDVEMQPRIGNGVCSQPDFLNRGVGYRASSSVIKITGDGYADIYEEANRLVLSGVDPQLPGPGVQIKIFGLLDENDEYVGGVLDETTNDPDDLKLFSGVSAVDLGDDGTGVTRTVEFTITPRLRTEFNVAHGYVVELRQNYSQCRLSGHDFLDIGTGGFVQTNYPELYAGGKYFRASPENEVAEIDGGRVFYVSTDQDGNFRTGDLFGVQQSTGIVTVSAEFFDLDGLSELSLGGVRLGGTGTVVNEFSTDVTFSADSNNIVPTQKAIATFLADRLSVGGSDLEVNSITAGSINIGTVENNIKHTADGIINVLAPADFSGTDLSEAANVVQIRGSWVAQMLFLKPFNDTLQ